MIGCEQYKINSAQDINPCRLKFHTSFFEDSKHRTKMGGMTSATCKLWKKRDVRILFIGLDAAGKTTILYQLKLGELVTTIPTIGFNVETIDHGAVKFTAWDVGLRSGSRPLLRHYYSNTEAVVFVIDCNDKERYIEATDMLRETVEEDELRNVPILILANKQDMSGVMSREEITSDLMSKTYLTGRKWEVFPVSGLKGEGLRDGLDWLTGALTGQIITSSPKSETKKQQSDSASVENAKDVSKFSYFAGFLVSVKKLFV